MGHQSAYNLRMSAIEPGSNALNPSRLGRHALLRDEAGLGAP